MTADAGSSDPVGATTADEEARPSTVPRLPQRLLDTLFNPGELTATLAEHPRWGGALAVSVLLLGLGVALIPPEIIMEAQRLAALERGVEMPRLSDDMITVMRIVIPAFSMISATIITFALAGYCAVVFAFILGDEGTYRQYLAVVAHAMFVSALANLLLTPLRVATEDPQFRLSLGSFLVFLPQGYWLNVFRVLDLTQIWSMLITAQGVRAIDPRRGFLSAATILLGLLVAIALVAARFMP